jgi:hypothetical protein
LKWWNVVVEALGQCSVSSQASYSAYNSCNSYISEIRPVKAYNYRKGLYFLYCYNFYVRHLYSIVNKLINAGERVVSVIQNAGRII